MDVQPVPTATASAAVTGVTTPVEQAAAPGTSSGQPSSDQPAAAAQPTDRHAGIAPAIAKLFANGSAPAPVQLNVSYKVVNGHDIVTVFSDPKTGKEVAQFPSELLLGLAEFFDQQAGVTFDRNA